MERRRQVVARAGHRHMIFLHRLQERRLRARAGAVDFVGHQKLGEDRPRNEPERALAAVVRLHHLGPQYVGRHQVWRELDAVGLQAQDDAQRFHELGLGEARDADQKGMAAGQKGDERTLDDGFLAEDHATDAGPHLRDVCQCALGFGDHLLFGEPVFLHDDTHAASPFAEAAPRAVVSARLTRRRWHPKLECKSRIKADKRNNSDYFVTMAPDSKTAKGGLTGAGDTAGLEALIGRAARAGKGLPPVDRWNPEFCGDLDMEIKADGTWFYLGTPIGRMPLVQLFSTVLRKDEDGKTYLVTPVEKVGIRVVDAPFVAVEMNVSGEGDERVITFRTNVGDVVEAGPDHPLRFVDEDDTDGLKPYVHVRGRLEALVARPVMYEMVNHGEEIEVDGVAMFALRSKGMVFPIMPVERLRALSA